MSTPEQTPDQVLAALFATLQQRKGADPGQSYVAGLYAKGVDAILKKVGEEAGETLIAAKNLAHGASPDTRLAPPACTGPPLTFTCSPVSAVTRTVMLPLPVSGWRTK